MGHQLSGCTEQVLTVVHHQQQLLVLQVREQQGQRLRRRLVPQVQGRQNGVAHQRGILNLSELDQPGAVREAASEVGRHPDRQAGLADPARPDEADQAGGGEPLSQFRQLAAAADEAGRFRRQVAQAVGGPGHGQQDCTTAAGERLSGRLSTQSGIPRMSARGRAP